MDGKELEDTGSSYQDVIQSIGEQGRIFILEKLLQQICSDESAWVTLCEEITKYTE